jgi:hypothetical protein
MQHNEEPAIKMERTEDFHAAARALSDYIKALPLSRPENDALVALAVAQVQQAEKGAFAQGFRMGMEFQKWNRRKKDTSLEDIARAMQS